MACGATLVLGAALLAPSATLAEASPGAISTAASTGPVVTVPAAIDATGATDASAGLIAFLDTVPDGSTIEFPANGTFRMDVGLKFSDRHGLTFEGNGATLRSNGDVHETSSLFALWSGNTRITIRDFHLVGNSPSPGVYIPGSEGAHGVLVDGGSDVDVSGVTISDVYGDGFYVGSWADTVTFHDSTVRSNGRNGVSVIAGRNVSVEHVAFEKSGYCTFDIESNVSTEGATNIRFIDNMVGTWGNIFLAANGADGSVVDGVIVDGNSITGGTLLTDVTLARRRNITITNNTSTIPADGPVLRLAHIDGLTISGNTQPLKSGVLASISDSTGVAYAGPIAPASPTTVPPMIARVLAGIGLLLIVALALVVRSRRRRSTPRG